MHLGYSLLTLFPGRVGGSETNVRGLLGEFADGNGPERVTVFANRFVAAAYGEYERGPVSLHHVRSYRAGNSIPTRALAMSAARALPRLAARDVPPVDVVHYPVTVPIPRSDARRSSRSTTSSITTSHSSSPAPSAPTGAGRTTERRAPRRWSWR